MMLKTSSSNVRRFDSAQLVKPTPVQYSPSRDAVLICIIQQVESQSSSLANSVVRLLSRSNSATGVVITTLISLINIARPV